MFHDPTLRFTGTLVYFVALFCHRLYFTVTPVPKYNFLFFYNPDLIFLINKNKRFTLSELSDFRADQDKFPPLLHKKKPTRCTYFYVFSEFSQDLTLRVYRHPRLFIIYPIISSIPAFSALYLIFVCSS